MGAQFYYYFFIYGDIISLARLVATGPRPRLHFCIFFCTAQKVWPGQMMAEREGERGREEGEGKREGCIVAAVSILDRLQ